MKRSMLHRYFFEKRSVESLEDSLFTKKNNYPNGLVEEIIKNERHLNSQAPVAEEADEAKNEDEEKPISLTLNLPYAGVKGEQLVRKVTKYISKTVNKSKKVVTMQTVYRAKRLGSNFNIKDQIAFQHQHNVVYHGECPNRKCNSQYTGETKCRIGKRSGQHQGEDKQSHLFKHASRTRHKKVDIKSFRIIGKGYRSNLSRKISESLFIKKLKPDLNVQKESYKLSLFN